MNPSVLSSHPRRGSALLLTLWAIMLMSLSVIGLVRHVSRGLDESLAAEKEFRARLMLQSARVVAEHPAILRGDPLLRQQPSPVRSWEVHLTTEGSRVAVNQLAGSRLQQRLVRQLFEDWGLTAVDAESLVESLCDWTDADNEPRPHGTERDAYIALERPDFPYNKPFESIDDLLLVRGADLMDRMHPDWRDSFTLYGDGTIDVHTAPGPLLDALFHVTASETSRFLRARSGPDEIPETADDRRFTSLDEVRSLIDVPDSNYRFALPLLTLAHPIRRTDCVARAGALERRLTLLDGPGIHLIRRD